jgi:hypothetical protein
MSDNQGDRAMACLSATRKGRAWLDARLVEHMARGFETATPRRATEKAMTREEATALVRSDHAYHLAEFFYVARELGLLRRAPLTQLIARHNADMQDLINDPDRAKNMGLTSERIKKAVFTKDQQRKILEGQPGPPQQSVRLDQSDLGKLLSPLMSAENSRQILRAMTRGKLLATSGYPQALVSSTGVLEDYFGEHLLIIDRAIREGT